MQIDAIASNRKHLLPSNKNNGHKAGRCSGAKQLSPDKLLCDRLRVLKQLSLEHYRPSARNQLASLARFNKLLVSADLTNKLFKRTV